MLEIRRATSEDKESVREIHASTAGGEGTFDAGRLDELIRGWAVLVAEEAGEVIGFGNIEVRAAVM